jgi:hypothetical protein
MNEVYVALWVTDTGSIAGCEVFSTREEAVKHREYWDSKNREDATAYIRKKEIDEPLTWENERNRYLNGTLID